MSTRPVDWDGETYCVECWATPATHQRLTGLCGDTPVYELVCCDCATEDQAS